MNLSLFQTRVAEWATRTFPNSSAASTVEHLRREVDELAEAVEAGDVEAVQVESADCLILLCSLTSRVPFSLGDAAVVKQSFNERRAWGEPDAAGVVEHVRDETSEDADTIRAAMLRGQGRFVFSEAEIRAAATVEPVPARYAVQRDVSHRGARPSVCYVVYEQGPRGAHNADVLRTPRRVGVTEHAGDAKTARLVCDALNREVPR